MATIEKLVKALEALRVFQPSSFVEDTAKKKEQLPVSKKDKVSNSNTIADCICSHTLRNATDFPRFLGVVMETFLLLCDDAEADVRMVADECLNRTIKTLMETNLGRLQVELYKEIKKNGSARSLRAALWRFAELCHLIRPQKCRPYVVNLLPCLSKVCHRPEEAIQETLAAAMHKICPVLMGFTNDLEVKVLLKAFVPNLRGSSATMRRTAATALMLMCKESRKPDMFFAYLLSMLLDMVMPVDDVKEVHTLLGVLLMLRHMIPHLDDLEGQRHSTSSGHGGKNKDQDAKVTVEQLIQIYEIALHFCGHPDHNVVTAVLEMLQQLFRTTPSQLQHVLLTPGGIHATSIYAKDRPACLKHRVASHSKLPPVVDDMALEDDLDQGSEVTNSEGEPIMADFESPSEAERRDGSQDGELEDDAADENSLRDDNDDDVDMVKVSMAAEDDYANIEIGDMTDENKSTLSPSSSADTLSEARSSPLHITPVMSKPSSEDRLSDKNNGEEGLDGDIDVSEAIQQGIGRQASVRDGDIGGIVNDEVPLVYCSRLLCSQFLLTGYPGGLLPDRKVRVSVKSLALGCLASIMAIQPTVFLQELHLSSLQPGELQAVSDILLYTSHSDPQLKGNSSILIGNLVNAGLRQSHGKLDQWVQQHQPHAAQGGISSEGLLSYVLATLEDESSVAARLALIALKTCLPSLLLSMHSDLGLKVMLALLHLKDNPYWLVKVELLDLLGGIDYKIISYLETMSEGIRKGQYHFLGPLSIQDHVLNDVLLRLLGDEDGRVRHAAAAALVRIVPRLFYAVDNPLSDPVIAKAQAFTASYLDPVMHDWSHQPEPMVHGLVPPFHFDTTNQVAPVTEAALSRIIARAVEELTRSDSRHLTYGCVHALCLLSEKYFVSQYAASWSCCPLASHIMNASHNSRSRHVSGRSGTGSTSSVGGVSLEELASSSGGGPLPLILSLLVASPISLDLTAHTDALQLAGNGFAGAAYKCLRSPEEGGGGDDVRWSVLLDRLLVPLADQLLVHLARLLNIFTHVIEDQQPGPPASKPSLPSLPNAPSLSPIKRKAKGLKDDSAASSTQSPADKANTKLTAKDPAKEGEKEKSKKEGLGSFYSLPQYMKLYEVLKLAHSSVKISLELSSPEKLGGLLHVTLTCLSQMLEVACLQEVGKHAEELLGYLRSTVSLQDTASILCVQQLLKALFGTNLSSQQDGCQPTAGSRGKPGHATRLTSNISPGLYHCCFTAPYTQFTQRLASATFRSTTHLEQDDPYSLISLLKKRAEKKVPAILKPGSKTDKTSIASYIRLFEPLVIKALKQYTVTSSLQLQEQVLDLLSQLVQLRVNYCLLDSDQIFIGFVIKQFEYIEEGQIRNSESLVPHIFNFLVLLSYERYHSKTIIGMPKIIQLCDGVMASGQNHATHAICALQCVVYDLFVLRGTNKADAGKDLDTQREVVVSMLLRLIHYHQVLELFIVVLHQCQKDSEEKWKRLSRQVTDTVLPLLASHQLNLDSQVALDVVHRLFEAVAPSVFRPVDMLLKTLFAPPQDLGSLQSLQRWLCLVMVILRVLMSQSKEEVVLSRLSELGLGVNIHRHAVHPNPQALSKMADMDPLGVAVGSVPATSDSDSESGPEATNQVRSLTFQTAEEIFARFLIEAVGLVAMEIGSRSSSLTVSPDSFHFLCQELSHLLLYVAHMFQSGIYRRVATVAMTLLKLDTPSCLHSIQEINRAFQELSLVQPMLTMQWCNILILLNYQDQAWWARVLQTPKQYVMGSPSSPQCEPVESASTCNQSIHMEVVRKGGLILFCDYVCENLNDAEHMTWVVINHVNDLICLSQEPPVQDFISAIHRNSAASGLFIQAIHSRCQNLSRPSVAKKTLRCLEAIHMSQSGALLTLLIDKFLHTHHLAVSRLCDSIACRRVEMLLAENIQESSSQLPLEDLEKLLQFMKTNGLTRRHTRLASLLHKLRGLMCPESYLTLSPEKTHPLILTAANMAEIHVDKKLFVSVVRDQCYDSQASPRECAQLLQHLDYTSILSISMAKECSLAILEECIALGTQRTLHTIKVVRDTPRNPDSPQVSPSHGRTPDPLLQAAQLTLFRHINSLINQLPVPHQVLNYHDNMDAKEEQYRDKMDDDFFSDAAWLDGVAQLTAALLRYLVSLPLLPWQPAVPDESARDVARFAVLGMEILHWMLQHDQMVASSQVQAALECCSVVLHRPELDAVIGHKDQTSWVCAIIRTVHQLMASLLVLPGDRLVSLPNQDSQDDLHAHGFSAMQHAIRACDQMSELVHCLKTHLDPCAASPAVPRTLAAPLRNIIIGLARLPVVNSYARTPPLVWKLGWMPSPTGDMRTSLPPLPLDYLQDKDVLKEFIFRVIALGWTSRQQFEETWMCLLGVLNPVSLNDAEQHSSPEEDLDRCQCQVLATRCITALLLESMLCPQSGNPASSQCQYKPRDKPLAFLHTRVGKKLGYVRGIVEQELQALVRHRCDLSSHHVYTSSLTELDQERLLLVGNLERQVGQQQFDVGQMSVESIWASLGMLDVNPLHTDSGSESTTDTNSSVDTPSPQGIYPPVSVLGAAAHSAERSLAQGGLDVHSCLQFLLELYGQLLSPTASPRTPLMQFNETVKSVVALSDVFTEKPQFEWLLDVLLDVYKTHPVEDELVAQYIVVGVCKAASVVGMDLQAAERVVKLIDSSMKSTHLPTKIATLYGCLYLLETGMTEITQQILPGLMDYLAKTLGSITHDEVECFFTSSTIHSLQHVMVMWAATFFILENYQDDLKDLDFTSKMLQLSISTVSAHEDVTPLPVYVSVLRGLERLLLVEVLSKQDADKLVKLSVDRLGLPSPQRALAALGLMLTCMYSGKQEDQWSPTQAPETPDFSGDGPVPQDPESLIVAMERVTALFDRIRKGFPYEARVIVRILPAFLADFFPPQDIMNKVIGEFLSNQQPHPQLMAGVVFQVFEHLLQRRQQAVVQDWVMLSLSNFTQRTPVAMAIWSLTCFFTSASTNHWLRTLFPHVLRRMGKMEVLDRRFFCIAALDFYRQLSDAAIQRSFHSTFQSVATDPDTPYTQLLACLEGMH